MLTQNWFNVDPATLARKLLGCAITSAFGGRTTTGRLVETEAYLAEDDLAAHVVRGLKAATRAQRLGPGTLYVHPMRGRCGVDIVARGGSVLLRAAEPLDGLDIMEKRRGTAGVHRLMRGPACLTEALGITCALDGLSILDTECPVSIVPGDGIPQQRLTIGPRIGISRSVDLLLRFSIEDSKFVSGRAMTSAR